MEKTTYVNRIESRGRLVSIKNLKNGKKILKIFSKNGRDVYPTFICDENIKLDFSAHARLYVEGYVRTYNSKSKDGYRENQQFIATKVEEDKTWTEMAFGEKGKFFPPMDTKIFIKGTLHSFIEEDEWIRLKIKVPGVNSDDAYHIRLNMRRLERMFELKEGMDISAVCSLTTPRKDLNGEVVYFENILAMDIAAG